MFTRRHYIEIARILRERHVPRDVVDALATYFVLDNPRFDPDRFMQACGFKKKGSP